MLATTANRSHCYYFRVILGASRLPPRRERHLAWHFLGWFNEKFSALSPGLLATKEWSTQGSNFDLSNVVESQESSRCGWFQHSISFRGQNLSGSTQSSATPAALVSRERHKPEVPGTPTRRGAFDSAKNHKRQRRKRQSVTAKSEKSQTPKFVWVRLGQVRLS